MLRLNRSLWATDAVDVDTPQRWEFDMKFNYRVPTIGNQLVLHVRNPDGGTTCIVQADWRMYYQYE